VNSRIEAGLVGATVWVVESVTQSPHT
jgi:hypothetical protein